MLRIISGVLIVVALSMLAAARIRRPNMPVAHSCACAPVASMLSWRPLNKGVSGDGENSKAYGVDEGPRARPEGALEKQNAGGEDRQGDEANRGSHSAEGHGPWHSSGAQALTRVGLFGRFHRRKRSRHGTPMPSEFYDEIIYQHARCLPNIKEPRTTPRLRLHARDARSGDTARGTRVRSLAMPKMSKPGGGPGSFARWLRRVRGTVGPQGAWKPQEQFTSIDVVSIGPSDRWRCWVAKFLCVATSARRQLRYRDPEARRPGLRACFSLVWARIECRPAFVFVLLSLAFGSAISVVVPPLRGPDEIAHFVRIYSYARGELLPTAEVDGRKGLFIEHELHRQLSFFKDAGERFARNREQGLRYSEIM